MTKEQKAKLNKEFGLCMKAACNYKPPKIELTAEKTMKAACNYKPPKIELTAEKTMKLKLASLYGKMIGGNHA